MSEKLMTLAEENSEFLLYNTEAGSTRVQVRLYEGSVWLSQAPIADLYDRSVKTISDHINNIFEEGELSEENTIRYFDLERKEGAGSVSLGDARDRVCREYDIFSERVSAAEKMADDEEFDNLISEVIKRPESELMGGNGSDEKQQL